MRTVCLTIVLAVTIQHPTKGAPLFTPPWKPATNDPSIVTVFCRSQADVHITRGMMYTHLWLFSDGSLSYDVRPLADEKLARSVRGAALCATGGTVVVVVGNAKGTSLDALRQALDRVYQAILAARPKKQARISIVVCAEPWRSLHEEKSRSKGLSSPRTPSGNCTSRSDMRRSRRRPRRSR